MSRLHLLPNNSYLSKTESCCLNMTFKGAKFIKLKFNSQEPWCQQLCIVLFAVRVLHVTRADSTPLIQDPGRRWCGFSGFRLYILTWSCGVNISHFRKVQNNNKWTNAARNDWLTSERPKTCSMSVVNRYFSWLGHKNTRMFSSKLRTWHMFSFSVIAAFKAQI